MTSHQSHRLTLPTNRTTYTNVCIDGFGNITPWEGVNPLPSLLGFPLESITLTLSKH